MLGSSSHGADEGSSELFFDDGDDGDDDGTGGFEMRPVGTAVQPASAAHRNHRHSSSSHRHHHRSGKQQQQQRSSAYVDTAEPAEVAPPPPPALSPTALLLAQQQQQQSSSKTPAVPADDDVPLTERCPGCGVSVAVGALSEHERNDCPAAEVACPSPGCGARCRRGELAAHLGVCMFAPVCCPFAPECAWQGTPGELAAHLAAPDAQPRHMLAVLSAVRHVGERLARVEVALGSSSGGGGGGTFAWDPLRCSKSIAVSEARDTATSTADGSALCVATSSFVSGKHFFELEATVGRQEGGSGGVVGDVWFGLVPSTRVAELVTAGTDSMGVGVDLYNGRLTCAEPCKTSLSSLPVPTGGWSGHRLGILLDLDRGTVACFLQGVPLGVVFANLAAISDPIIPVCLLSTKGRSAKLITGIQPPHDPSFPERIADMDRRLNKLEVLTFACKDTLTWDPRKATPGLLLSQGNLQVASPPSCGPSACMTIMTAKGFLAGRHYLELAVYGGRAWVGISFIDHLPHIASVGNPTYGASMYTGNGELSCRAVIRKTCTKLQLPRGGLDGIAFGILIDLARGTISFNTGSGFVVAFSGIPPYTEVFPSVSFVSPSCTARLLPFK